MKVKTSELEGFELDYATLVSLNGEALLLHIYGPRFLGASISNWVLKEKANPSTNWSQCGPLLEKYHIVIESNMSDEWCAQAPHQDEGWVSMSGPSILIAGCRAIVAARWGDTVEIPDELVSKDG